MVVLDVVPALQARGAEELDGTQGAQPVGKIVLEAGCQRAVTWHGKEIGRSGTHRYEQPRAKRPGRRFDGIRQFASDGFDPGRFPKVLPAEQHHVDAVTVGRELTRRVQQRLKDLIERGECGPIGQPQLVNPEVKRLLDGLGREGGAYDERRAGLGVARGRGRLHSLNGKCGRGGHAVSSFLEIVDAKTLCAKNNSAESLPA
jgi:hypothetical protein